MSDARFAVPPAVGRSSTAGRPIRGAWLVLVATTLAAAAPAGLLGPVRGGGSGGPIPAWWGRPAPLSAQQVPEMTEPRTAITPAAVTVGEIFRAAIRVTAPPGVRVLFPDTLAVPADVEAAGRLAVRTDTVGGALEYTAVYPLTAWRPDTIALEAAAVRVVTDAGEQSLTARFVPFVIRSVLPADTAGIEAQPPKDVFGANRLLWPFLIGLALVLAALALFYVWRRRRRPPVTVTASVPAGAPRDRALAALDEARRAGLVEGGAFKEFYSRVSDTLRQYLSELEPRWGADLTTTELAGRMRDGQPNPDVAALFAVLGQADLVKFARGRPAAMDAFASWGTARGFVERFETPAVRAARAQAETGAEAA